MHLELFANKLVESWKSIIETINVDGYYRKVSSFFLYETHRYQSNRTFKVIYFYEESKSDNFLNLDIWNSVLEKKLIEIFCDCKTKIGPKVGYLKGELLFENCKVEFIQNNKYKLVIQFYPAGFIDEKRSTIIKDLGI